MLLLLFFPPPALLCLILLAGCGIFYDNMILNHMYTHIYVEREASSLEINENLILLLLLLYNNKKLYIFFIFSL